MWAIVGVDGFPNHDDGSCSYMYKRARLLGQEEWERDVEKKGHSHSVPGQRSNRSGASGTPPNKARTPHSTEDQPPDALTVYLYPRRYRRCPCVCWCAARFELHTWKRQTCLIMYLSRASGATCVLLKKSQLGERVSRLTQKAYMCLLRGNCRKLCVYDNA